MLAIRRVLIFVAAAGLTGCGLLADREDTTVQHRSSGRARSDYKACAAEAGIVSLDPHPDYDQTEAVRQRLLACMYSRGWRATSLQHL
jgi:hypothetical protein